MRLNLFLSVLFFCTITKAQTSADLKEFINKNNVAVRSVQKNMLRENNSAYISVFKDILKNQEAAVKLYPTDKNQSSHFALLVRNECLSFLKNHSQGSTQYFEISDAEKEFLKAGSESTTKVLTATEQKKIDDMDAMLPQSLNTLTLTIQ